MRLYLQPESPDGGIGRRVRLKIWYSQGCAGSIPVPGTEKSCKLIYRAFLLALTNDPATGFINPMAPMLPALFIAR